MRRRRERRSATPTRDSRRISPAELLGRHADAVPVRAALERVGRGGRAEVRRRPRGRRERGEPRRPRRRLEMARRRRRRLERRPRGRRRGRLEGRRRDRPGRGPRRRLRVRVRRRRAGRPRRRPDVRRRRRGERRQAEVVSGAEPRDVGVARARRAARVLALVGRHEQHRVRAQHDQQPQHGVSLRRVHLYWLDRDCNWRQNDEQNRKLVYYGPRRSHSRHDVSTSTCH